MASRQEKIRSAMLVLEHRAGDPAALGKIVRMWERPLLYYLRRLVDREEDAWDLLQEVWCRMMRKMKTLREPSALPAWLYAIARNAARSHLRKSLSDEGWRDPDPAALENVSDGPVPTFAAEELHWALGRLGLLHREALVLHYFEGFSLAEIAGIVGAPVGTVKSRLYHAKKALRAVLEEEA